MKRRIIAIIGLLGLCGLFAFSVLLALVYHSVSREAADRIQRGAIDKIIFSESPVYYDDGKSIIGVFFEKTHRKYIHYRDIPSYFIKALIASEDKNFFSHPGFDVKSIMRATLANMRAGRVVQGGSTLTQQTAKNIFERQKRSFNAKLKELMQALLLERAYSKEEILEMYVNQFFVTGFGRGLEIAAQYFFDKESKDLDLAECAFIAGSVKSPNTYNPFTKKTSSQRTEALKRAKARKDYVLENMFRQEFITSEQYHEALKKEVPFKEGNVTYTLNVILDYVREQLESDYFRAILAEQGLDNIATSGMRIFTSINKEIQEGALESIRRHLPLLDVKLNGYERHAVQERYTQQAETSLKKRDTNIPFLCRITHIGRQKDNPHLIVAWENGGGIIDYDGLKPMAEAWLQGERGHGLRRDRGDLEVFLNNFQLGDLLAVQSLDNGRKSEQRGLMLSAIPTLEGGIAVIHNGMIKAMIGGFYDRFFNRAVDAKRQLGSIFKPIVYTAALQLKWNTLDSLNNTRDLFRFENTHYLPKPDHAPKSDEVSMLWAGAKSENLATVWLLYHLTDHLNMGEFSKVVEGVGLARRQDESYGQYVERIRDRHGIVVDNQALMSAAFAQTRKEIVSDLIFAGEGDVLSSLERLHFDIDPTQLDPEDPEEFQIHRLGFQRLQSLNAEMKEGLEKIKRLRNEYETEGHPDLLESISQAIRCYYLSSDAKDPNRIVYKQTLQKTDTHLYPLTPPWVMEHIDQMSSDDIRIDDLMTSKAIDLIQNHTNENFKGLLDYKRYDKEVLYNTRDFRTLVNLLYVTRLGRELGITTPLDAVLSFPLGANAVSITEAALAYHALMTGEVQPFPGKAVSEMTPIITRIEDRNGEIIWEYAARRKKVLSDRISSAVSEVLRMVMEKGTGTNAKNAVQLSLDLGESKISIPMVSFGKTGTSNAFTNSSFVGFIPGPEKGTGELDLKEGYVVAGYVGYDDNRPMKGKFVRIYGASGALPLWIDTTNRIVNSADYKSGLRVADLAFGTQKTPYSDLKGLSEVFVSPVTGLPIEPGRESPEGPVISVFADIKTGSGTFGALNRLFEPLTVEYDNATNQD
ncbi:MAG: transglycosylase domain-containing protein [Desulfatiglandales bacterium]